ncbi:unnamed protein product [Notodromas monacha]|uniref:Transmembrane protein n=1 Tax=Notodromas monacha TaxID=399045 RepID=A0A7R9GIT0_9CRUS|nr:unnamed protein product [Notodromas monacha]CAG0922130.1 unnamed protein product [Notodromas monacha]
MPSFLRQHIVWFLPLLVLDFVLIAVLTWLLVSKIKEYEDDEDDDDDDGNMQVPATLYVAAVLVPLLLLLFPILVLVALKYFKGFWLISALTNKRRNVVPGRQVHVPQREAQSEVPLRILASEQRTSHEPLQHLYDLPPSYDEAVEKEPSAPPSQELVQKEPL